MPEDKKVRIGIETTADPKGITQTQADLRNLTSSIDGAQSSVDELERELQQAEAVLNRSGAGSNKFRKLRAEIARAKQELATLRVGELDARGLERLNQRLDRLRSRAQQARTSLERPPNTSWATEASNKFRELANSIPGGSKVTALLGSITKGGGPAVAAIGAVTAAIGALIGITRQGIGNIAIIEDLEASFTTLLGSVELAQAKIADIRRIAAETPISVGDLATVARQLNGITVEGKSAEEVLRLVGDAATVAQRPGISLGQSAQELSIHYRRVVQALKSGSGEIGESTNRFRELNVVQNEVVEQLREMHKQGGRGQEAILLLNNSLERFEGEMVRRSKTISGAQNNLGDAWSKLSSTVAAPFAPGYKSSLQNLTNLLNGTADQIQAITRKIGESFGFQSLAAERANVAVTQSMAEAADSVGTVADAASAGTAAAKASLSQLSASFESAAESAKTLLDQQNKLASAELQLELATIEASDLSDVEKTQKSAEARIRAAAEKTNRELDAARERIKSEREQVQAVRDEIALLAAKGEDAKFKLDSLEGAPETAIENLKRLRERLDDAESSLQRVKAIGAVAKFGTLGIESPGSKELAEKLTANIDKYKSAIESLEKRLSNYDKQQRALERTIADSAAAIKEQENALVSQESQARINIATAEREITVKEKLAALEKKANTTRANTQVREQTQKQIQGESDDQTKEIEMSLKDAERAQKKQSEQIAKQLEDLRAFVTVDKLEDRIDEAIKGLQNGDITQALKLAGQAVSKTTQDELSNAGESLEDLLGKYQKASKGIDTAKAKLLAKQRELNNELAAAAKIEITALPPRKEDVERRITDVIKEGPPKPKPTTRKVTDELVKEAPAPKDVQRGVSDIIRAFAASPEPVERRVDDVSGDQVEPPQKTIQLVQRIVDQLADPEAVSQEIRRIATEFDLPSNVQQVVDRVLGQTPGEPETTTQKVERQIVGTLETPDPVTQAVDRKVIDRGSRPTPSDEASNDVPARTLTENQRSSNDERESPIAQQFATPAQQPVVIEEAKLTAPSAAEQGPRDAIDVEPVVSATQDNGRELEAGLSRVVTAQRTGTQQVASAIDATATAVVDATVTIVTKLTDVQDKLSTLESQVKNAR